jgi:hypothetical protein
MRPGCCWRPGAAQPALRPDDARGGGGGRRPAPSSPAPAKARRDDRRRRDGDRLRPAGRAALPRPACRDCDVPGRRARRHALPQPRRS